MNMDLGVTYPSNIDSVVLYSSAGFPIQGEATPVSIFTRNITANRYISILELIQYSESVPNGYCISVDSSQVIGTINKLSISSLLEIHYMTPLDTSVILNGYEIWTW